MIKLSILIPVWNQEKLIIRALDHIPRRDDIEVIVCDDGSTDNTLMAVNRYKKEHPELNITVLANQENMGGACTCNRLLEAANGEWIHVNDSDDYAITDVYSRMIDEWLNDSNDIVTMDMEIDSGERLVVNEYTQREICAQIARFIRKSLFDGIRFIDGLRWAYDMYVNNELLAKNPRIAFSGITAYHYTFPRQGSLTDLYHRGLLS